MGLVGLVVAVAQILMPASLQRNGNCKQDDAAYGEMAICGVVEGVYFEGEISFCEGYMRPSASGYSGSLLLFATDGSPVTWKLQLDDQQMFKTAEHLVNKRVRVLG